MADHTTYGLVCSELSEDLSKTNLGELKLDSFQDNSVQIKIKAASLNFPDLLMTQGKYQNRPDLPFALGMEGAGIVEKVGSGVSSFKEGDEVMFGGWGHGAIADGGIMSTKPYTCGSNYVLKMSNYKKGPWCEVLDGLYWRFTEKHRDFYESNPRLSILSRSLDKMNPERKERIFGFADEFIKKNSL